MLKNNKIISSLFILFGAIFLLIASILAWQRNNPKRLAFKTSLKNNHKIINNDKSIPKSIIIKDLKISLPIIPSKFNNGIWEETNKGVSYLLSSPIPGEKGNSILYGHNWPNLLGNLRKAKIGQEISLDYNKNARKYFTIKKISIVSPDQIAILNKTDDARITLYTCNGFLDSKRLVIVAFLKK